jgi:hypothetical protein
MGLGPALGSQRRGVVWGVVADASTHAPRNDEFGPWTDQTAGRARATQSGRCQRSNAQQPACTAGRCRAPNACALTCQWPSRRPARAPPSHEAATAAAAASRRCPQPPSASRASDVPRPWRVGVWRGQPARNERGSGVESGCGVPGPVLRVLCACLRPHLCDVAFDLPPDEKTLDAVLHLQRVSRWPEASYRWLRPQRTGRHTRF